MKPKICILRTDGTNCDEETAHAFRQANGEPFLVHVNALRLGRDQLANYQILVLPGGFSYGDDVASGKVLAIELISFLRDQLRAFIEAGKLVLGICNGFQVLVRTGVLPYRQLGTLSTTLTHNASGHFQCEWVDLRPIRESPCIFTRGLSECFPLQIAHGEGRFLTSTETLTCLQNDGLIALRYDQNPNGSQDAIAGICDPSGRIFGLMPHPERSIRPDQHPNWRRQNGQRPEGILIFENAVREATQL